MNPPLTHFPLTFFASEPCAVIEPLARRETLSSLRDHVILAAMRARPYLVALAMGLALATTASIASATDVELQAMEGPTLLASTWRGDFGIGETLRAGVRIARVVSFDFQGWESYATVDHRLNTGLSLGITGYLPLEGAHPYLRLYALHQHEEGLVSALNTPFGTLFGIGDGIRHRAGGGLCAGVEIPLRPKANDRLAWMLLPEMSTAIFPDATLGPLGYVNVSLALGANFLVNP